MPKSFISLWKLAEFSDCLLESKASLISASISRPDSVLMFSEKSDEEPNLRAVVSPKYNGSSSTTPCLWPFTYAVWQQTQHVAISYIEPSVLCALYFDQNDTHNYLLTNARTALAFWTYARNLSSEAVPRCSCQLQHRTCDQYCINSVVIC